MSDLVGNTEDRFSHNEAQILFQSKTAVQVPVRSSTPTPEEEQLEGLNQMTNSRLAANFAQAQFNGKITYEIL